MAKPVIGAGEGKAREEAEPAPTSQRRRLAPYRTPRLECHGSLIDLTRFGGSEILDSGGGLQTQQ